MSYYSPTELMPTTAIADLLGLGLFEFEDEVKRGHFPVSRFGFWDGFDQFWTKAEVARVIKASDEVLREDMPDVPLPACLEGCSEPRRREMLEKVENYPSTDAISIELLDAPAHDYKALDMAYKKVAARIFARIDRLDRQREFYPFRSTYLFSPNRPGFKQWGQVTVRYYIPPKYFREHICDQFDNGREERCVIYALALRGYIEGESRNGDYRRFVKFVSTPEPVEVYVITFPRFDIAIKKPVQVPEQAALEEPAAAN